MRGVPLQVAIIAAVLGAWALVAPANAQFPARIRGSRPEASESGIGRPSAPRRANYLQAPPSSDATTEPVPVPEPSDESEPLVDDYLADDSEGAGECGYDGCVLDDPIWHEGGDALIPEGMFSNCGPVWFASVQATLLHRQAPQKAPLSTLRELQIVGNTVVNLSPTVLATTDLNPPFEPGLRLKIGRNLYRDILNRQHSIEFDFLGLNHWSSQDVAFGFPQISTSTFFKFAGLFTLFPLTTGGFNAANTHSFFNQSRMNNYEINYRVGQLPRPDRVAQKPDGTWVRVGTPSLTYGFLGGIRAVSFNDSFQWLSDGVHTNGQGFSGNYNIRTSNVLLGGQLGGDLIANYSIFTLGVRSKVGIYGNNANQSSQIEIIDPILGNDGRQTQFRSTVIGFVGDTSMFGTVKLNSWLNFNAAYDFMWVSGLAIAPQNVQYDLTAPPAVYAKGHLLFQGVSLGFDARW